MGKLARRFRRELAASPKKAAVLGLLALVAVYYWTPLVWDWAGKGNEMHEAGIVAVPPAAPGTGTPAPATTAAPANAATASIPWQQVIELIESDERTLAAELKGLRRDPFVLKKPDAAKIRAEAETAASAEAADAAASQGPAAAVTPQGLGLTLTTTIIGADRRLARIGGRTYAQGQTIQVRKDGQTVGFLLAEVHARRVVLTRDDNRYELTIPDPLQSKKIELSRSGE